MRLRTRSRASLLLLVPWLVLTLAAMALAEYGAIGFTSSLASDSSETIPSSSIKPSPTYNRKDFRHWIDSNKDCQDTRQEVLIAESLVPVLMDKKGCRVVSGLWEDPYTGKSYRNPKDLDVDHTIPLKLAAVSGGMTWSKEKKAKYANHLADPDHLIAIYKSVNRSKGAKPIDEWGPPKSHGVLQPWVLEEQNAWEARRCWYAHSYIKIKQQWDLTFTDAEVKQLAIDLKRCGEDEPEYDLKDILQ